MHFTAFSPGSGVCLLTAPLFSARVLGVETRFTCQPPLGRTGLRLVGVTGGGRAKGFVTVPSGSRRKLHGRSLSPFLVHSRCQPFGLCSLVIILTMYPRHWSRWQLPVMVPCGELRMISPVTLPDVSGVAGGVMGNIFEGVVLGTAGVTLFASVVLGVLAILAVPKVLVEFLFGVLILWRTGAGAIFSWSVKRSRQLVRSKLVPGNIAIERCDGRKGAAERVRNLKIQRRCGRKRVMVWGSEISKLESVRGTSDGARVLNLRIQRKCGRKQVMGRR